MLKTTFAALFALIIMTSTSYAENTIKLNANESKSLTNHYMWTLNATCNIHSNQSKNKILVSVLENKGSVNGKNLTKGQKTAVTVNNNQSISVSAEPGTKVNIVNLGTDPVQAVCSS